AAPCMPPCAVTQDVPESIAQVGAGDYDRALAIILARNPLPGITGYICDHACQTRCTRSDYDEPVAIRALKRVAFERGRVEMTPAAPTGKRVAIIGAGPSGLSAASFLALNGVQATIYEAQDHAGGMAALAPKFRLPDAVIQRDVDLITGLGVEIETSRRIDTTPESLLEKGFDAVYVATGFQNDSKLDIPGIDGEGVHTALDFLARVSAGERPEMGREVLVIGGGNTAVDAARTASRLIGKPATIVYRRTEAEMPADLEEIEDMRTESMGLETLVSPSRVVLDDGRVTGLECVRNELGEPDASGRRRPVEIPGSEFTLPADAVIVAIGQAADLRLLDGSGLSTRRNGAIEVDPETGRALDLIFAGGDAVRGPETIIAACADGRRAAETLCTEFGVDFRTYEVTTPEMSDEEVARMKRIRARKEPQHHPASRPLDDRFGFELVDETLDEQAAHAEAARCLQCTTLCDKCVDVCPNRANITYLMEPVDVTVPVLACRDGALVVVGKERVQIEQTRQILHLDDFCNDCGNCATFCVHHGRPYVEKPRLFLREADFLAEGDNAVFVEGDTIRRLSGGRESRLTVGGELVFETEQVRVTMTPVYEIIDSGLKQPFEEVLSLAEAVDLQAVLVGVKGSI
ncbi:FAD-dependent oxidoreductase, partial [bacterium]|nr:FAD-dependent oxidoreductase [bacterium]